MAISAFAACYGLIAIFVEVLAYWVPSEEPSPLMMLVGVLLVVASSVAYSARKRERDDRV